MEKDNSTCVMSEFSGLDTTIDAQADRAIDSAQHIFNSKYSSQCDVFRNSPRYLFCKSSIYFKDIFEDRFIISSAHRIYFKSLIFNLDTVQLDQDSIEQDFVDKIHTIAQQLIDAVKNDDNTLIASLVWDMINLSLDDSRAQFLFGGVPGVCRTIVVILTKFDYDLALIEAALTAISVLTRCGKDRSLTSMKNLNLFMAAQVPDIVVKIAKRHYADAGICERVGLCISHLAYDKKQRLQFASAGACELLVDMMKFHSSNMPVLERCFCATLNLIPEDSCYVLFSQLSLHSLLMTYIQCDNESTVSSICTILTIIYNHRHMPSEEHAKLDNCAVWMELLEVFGTWKESSQVISSCVAAMALMLLQVPMDVSIGDASLCGGIVRMVRAYPASRLLKVYGVIAITSLYHRLGSLRDVLPHMEECALLVGLLKIISDVNVAHLACMGLVELVHCNHDFAGYLQSIGLCRVIVNALENLISTSRNQSEPPGVLLAICSLLAAISSQNSDTQTALLQAGTAEQLTQTLLSYGDDIQCRAYIMRAITHVSGLYNIDKDWNCSGATAFFELGVMDVVVPLLTQSDLTVVSIPDAHMADVYRTSCHIVCAVSLAGHMQHDYCKVLVPALMVLLSARNVDLSTAACTALACLSATEQFNNVLEGSNLDETLLTLLHQRQVDASFFPCCCLTLRNLLYCRGSVGAMAYIESGILRRLTDSLSDCTHIVVAFRAAISLLGSIIETACTSRDDNDKDDKNDKNTTLVLPDTDEVSRQLFWLLQKKSNDDFVVLSVVRIVLKLSTATCLSPLDLSHRPVYGESIVTAAALHVDKDEVCALCLDLLSIMSPIFPLLPPKDTCSLITEALKRQETGNQAARCACYLLSILPGDLCREHYVMFHADECSALASILATAIKEGDTTSMCYVMKTVCNVLRVEPSCQEQLASRELAASLLTCLHSTVDITVKLCALWTMKYLCMSTYHSDPHVKAIQDVVQGDGINAIMPLLHSHLMSHEVVLTCCCVLRCLSTTQDGVRQCRSRQLCECLFSVMKNYRQEDAIVIQSCDVLTCILPFDAIYLIVRENIDFLCDMLIAKPNALVTCSCLRFIISLLDEADEQHLFTMLTLMFEREILTLLMTIAADNPSDTILNCIIITCLTVIVRNNSSYQLKLLNNSDGVMFIQRALNSSDSTTVALTIDLLVGILDNDCKLHDSLKNYPLSVADVLIRYVDNVRIARNCCTLLRLFCDTNPSCIEALVLKNLQGLVMTVCRQHNSDSKLASVASDLMVILTESEGGLVACEAAIASLQVALDSTDDTEVVRTLSIVQKLILDNVDDQGRMSTPTTMGGLLQLLWKWQDNHFVVSCILKALWCMCRSIPTGSTYVATTVDLLVAESGHLGVLSVLTSLWTYPKVAEFAFAILCFVVSHCPEEGGRLDITRLADLSVSVLQTLQDDCNVVTNVSLFIAAAVALPEHSSAFENLDICGLLASAIERFCGNEDCVLQIILALSGLVYVQGPKLAGHFIHDEGNISGLLQVIGMHSLSSQVVSAVCVLIVNLTILLEGDFTTVFQSCCGAEAMISIIRQCTSIDQRDILGHVLDVIYILCMNDCDISTQLIDLDALDLLIAAMENDFRHDTKVLKMCCLCTYAMIDVDTADTTDFSVIFRVALGVLQGPNKGDVEVVLATTMVLSNLLVKPEVASILMDMEPMETIVVTFVTHAAVKDIITHCCSIFIALMEYSKTCDWLCSVDTLGPLVAAMHNHLGDAATCIKLTDLLIHMMACDPLLAGALVENSICEVVKDILHNHAQNIDVLPHLYTCITKLCLTADLAQQVMDGGVLTAVFAAHALSDILDEKSAIAWVRLLQHVSELAVCTLRVCEESNLPEKLMSMFDRHKESQEFILMSGSVVDMLCNSYEMCTALGRLGCCQFIAQQLVVYKDAPDIAVALLKAVGGLCTNPENQLVLGDMETCSCIVKLLECNTDIKLSVLKAVTALAFENLTVQERLFALNVHILGLNSLQRQEGNKDMEAVVMMCIAMLAESQPDCMHWCIEKNVFDVMHGYYTAINTVDRNTLILCTSTAMMMSYPEAQPLLSSERFILHTIVLWNRVLEMSTDMSICRPLLLELLRITLRFLSDTKRMTLANPSELSDVIERTLHCRDLDVSYVVIVVDIVETVSEGNEEIAVALCRAGVLNTLAGLLRSDSESNQLVCALCTSLKYFTRWEAIVPLACTECRLIEELKVVLDKNAHFPVVVGNVCSIATNMLRYDPSVFECEAFCNAIIVSLSTFVDKENIVPSLCAVVSDMATVASLSDKLGGLGVCRVLLDVIRLHGDKEDVLAYAAKALQNLTAESVLNVVEFGDMGVGEILIDCTRNCSRLETLIVITMALTNLCSDNERNCLRVTGYNGAEVLINLLQKHHDSADAVIAFCSILQAIASFDTNVQLLLATPDVSEMLHGLVEQSKCNPEVLSLSLSVLSIGGTASTENFLEGVCNNLIEAITSHVHDASMVEQVCTSINAMIISSPISAEVLGACGMCTLVVEVAEKYICAPSVLERVLILLGYMVMESEDNLVKLDTTNVHDLLIRSLQTHPDNSAIFCAVSFAIRYLAYSLTCSHALNAIGLTDLLVVGLDKFTAGHDDVSENACRAIRKLIASEITLGNSEWISSSVVEGGVMAAVHVARFHEKKVDCVDASLSLLHTLIPLSHAKDVFMGQEECDIKWIVDFGGMHLDNRWVVLHAAGIISALLCTPAYVAALNGTKTYAFFLIVVAHYHNAPDVIEDGYAAILAMTKYDPKHIVTLLANDHVETMLSCLEYCSQNHRAVVKVFGLIEFLGHFCDGVTRMSQAKIYALVTSIGFAHISESAVAGSLFAIIITFVSTKAEEGSKWGESGMCQLCAEGLLRHTGDEELTTQGFLAMWYLLSSCESNATYFCNAESVGVIVAAMEMSADSSEVTLLNSLLSVELVILANTDTISLFTVTDIVSVTSKILRQHHSKSDGLFLPALRVVTLLSTTSESRMKYYECNLHEVFGDIFQRLASYESDQVRTTFAALGELCNGCEAIQMYFFEKKWVTFITGLLEKSREDLLLWVQICRVVCNLAKCPHAQPLPDAVLRHVLNVMRGHITDISVCRVACDYVHVACSHTGTNIVSRMIDPIENVYNVMKHYENNLFIEVIRVVSVVCLHRAYGQALKSTDAISILLRALCNASPSSQMHECVTRTIYVMLCDQAQRIDMPNSDDESSLVAESCRLLRSESATDVTVLNTAELVHAMIIGRDDKITRAGDIGICEAICTTVKRRLVSWVDMSLCKEICDIIISLSTNSKCRIKMVVAGLLEYAVDVMECSFDRQCVLYTFCMVSQAYTTEGIPDRNKFQTAIGMSGVISSFLKAIECHIDNSEVVLCAMTAMRSLCHQHAANCDSITQEQGVPLLCRVLSKLHQVDLEIARACSGALLALSEGSGEARQSLSQYGFCEYMVTCLRQALTSRDFISCDIFLTVIAVSMTESRNRLVFADMEALYICLFQLLSADVKMSLQSSSLNCLALLCTLDEGHKPCNDIATLLRKYDVYSHLSLVCRNHRNTSKCMKQSCDILNYVLCGECTDAIDKLQDFGYCGIVLEILKEHVSEVEVMQSCCMLLSNLLTAPANRLQCKELGIALCISPVFRKHEGNYIITTVCFEVVKWYDADGDALNDFGRAGYCEILVDILKICRKEGHAYQVALVHTLLSLLATSQVQNINTYVEEGGDIASLEYLGWLVAEGGDKELIYKNCDLLCNIWSHRRTLQPTLVSDLLLALFSQYVEDKRIFCSSCKCLSILIASGSDCVGTITGRQDIVPFVVEGMNLHYVFGGMELLVDMGCILNRLVDDWACAITLPMQVPLDHVVEIAASAAEYFSDDVNKMCYLCAMLYLAARAPSKGDTGKWRRFIFEFLGENIDKYRAQPLVLASLFRVFIDVEHQFPKQIPHTVIHAVCNAFQQVHVVFAEEHFPEASVRLIREITQPDGTYINATHTAIASFLSTTMQEAVELRRFDIVELTSIAVTNLCVNVVRYQQILSTTSICTHIHQALHHMKTSHSCLVAILDSIGYLCGQGDFLCVPNRDAFVSHESDKIIISYVEQTLTSPELVRSLFHALASFTSDTGVTRRIGEMGLCGVITGVFHAFARSAPDFLPHGLLVLSNIASVESNCAKLADKPTLLTLLDVLSSIGEHNLALGERSTSLLRKLIPCAQKDIIAEFGKEKGCSDITRALRFHMTALHDSISLDLCYVVLGMSNKVNGNKQLFCDFGVPEVVVQLLRSHKDVTAMSFAGSRVLRSLSFLGTAAEVICAVGYGDVVVSMIGRHMSDIDVIDSIIGTSANIASHGCGKRLITDTGFCNAVLECCDRYSTSAAISASCCCVFTAQCHHTSTAMYLCTNGLCDLVVRVLRGHISMEGVLKYGCATARHITTHPDNTHMFIRAGGVVVLCDILKEAASSPIIVENTLLSLTSAVRSAYFDEHFGSSACGILENACKFVGSSLLTFPSIPDILVASCGLLHVIIASPSNTSGGDQSGTKPIFNSQQRFLEEGVVDTLCKSCEQYSSQRDILAVIVEALVTLSRGNPATRALIAVHDPFENLLGGIRMSECQDSRYVVCLAIAVTALCEQNKVSADSVVLYGGCEVFVKQLQTAETDAEVVLWCCRALSVLYGNQSGHVDAKEASLGITLCRCLKIHVEQESVLAALCDLSSHIMQAPGMIDQFGAQEACLTLVRGIVIHVTSTNSVIDHLFAVVRVLSESVTNVGMFVEADIASLCLRVLADRSDAAALVGDITGAMIQFLAVEAGRVEFIQCPEIYALLCKILALYENDDMVVCNTCQCIIAISKVEPQRSRMGETDIFHILHDHFKRRIDDCSPVNQSVLAVLVQSVTCLGMENTVNAAHMRVAGICQYIASIFLLYQRDCALTRYGFVAVGIICIDKENKEVLATPTNCTNMVTILEKGIADSDFSVIVLTAIYNVCAGYAAAKDMFCDVGLCKVVLEILRGEATRLEVVSVSCAVLWSLVNASARNAAVLSAVVCCAEVIVDTLRLHLNIPAVSGALCGILSEILVDKNHFPGLRVHSVDEIALSLLHVHKNQPEFAVHLALRLLRLMYKYEVDTHGTDTSVPKVSKIIDILAGLFSTVKADIKILQELCGLITLIASSHFEQKWHILAKYPFPEYVCSTLLVAIKAKHANLAVIALQTVESLCQGNASNQDTFGKLGACSSSLTILDTMKPSSTQISVDLEVACLAVLVVLVRHGTSKDSESTSNIELLMKHGVCEAVIACLQRRLETQERVTSLACRCISYLASNEKCSARLTRGGVCDMIVTVHRRYAASVSVAQYASGAVANLALLDDANALLVNGGAVEAMIATLKTSGYQANEVAKMTCIALDNLIGNREPVRKRMGQHGAMAAVLQVLSTGAIDKATARAACSAAANIISNDPDNASTANQLGGCSVVMACGSAHQDDRGVCYSALLFCVSMCNAITESTVSFLEHGVCSLLSHTLSSHCRIKEHVRLCCVAINALCNAETSAPAMMGTCSIPEKLVAAVQHHLQDPAVIIVGIRAMVTLMEGCELNQQRFNSIDTTGVVFCALSLDPIPRSVAENACDCIVFLCRDISTKMQLKQARVCPRMCTLLKLFMMDEDMIVRICLCIRMLSANCVEVKVAFTECSLSESIIACFKVHCMSRDTGLQISMTIWELLQDNMIALAEYTGEALCQAVSSLMVKYYQDEECVKYTNRLMKLLARSDENRRILGGSGVCGVIAAALTTFMTCREVVVEVLATIHALAVDNKANVELLGFKGVCESVGQALDTYGTDQPIVNRCLKIITCLCVNPQNSTRLGNSKVCSNIVELLNVHGNEVGLLKLSCVAISALCSNVDDVNRESFVQADICTSLRTLMQQYTSDALLMELLCVALLGLLETVEKERCAACVVPVLVEAQLVSHLANLMQANLGLSRVIKSACGVVIAIATSSKGPEIDFVESGICEKLVLCLSCHLSDKCANIDICACVRVIAATAVNKYTFGKLGACEVLWKALQFAVDFEDIKLIQAALMTSAELVRDSCANQGHFSGTEICNVVSEVVGAENGIMVDENALWCIAYLCRCSEDVSTLHEQNACKFGENGVLGSIVTVLQEHGDHAGVIMAGLTALRNLSGYQRNIGRIGVFGCCQLTCTLLRERLHDASICRIGCDAISCFAVGKNIQDLLDCDVGELLILILRRHADQIPVLTSVCDCIICISPHSQGEFVFERSVCSLLAEGCRQHSQNALTAEKICTATKSLCDENERYKLEFGNVGMCEVIVRILKVHAPNSPAVTSAVVALNSLMRDCHENEEKIRLVGGLSLLSTSSRTLGLWTVAMDQE